MKLSVVIPAYNEEESLPETLTTLYSTLSKENIDHEIVVTNDNSKDNTLQVLEELKKNNSNFSILYKSRTEWFWLCCALWFRTIHR